MDQTLKVSASYHEEVKVGEAELHVVALAERTAGGERPVLGELALHVDDDVLVDKVRLWRNTADMMKYPNQPTKASRRNDGSPHQ